MANTKVARSLVGEVFTRLTVMAFSHRDKSGNRYWKCLCVCGETRVVGHTALVYEQQFSCGCYAREVKQRRSTKHGMWGSPEYRIRLGMIQRCYNPKNTAFAFYGGRGITVWPEWRESFESFYRDVGPRPSPQHTLERKDNEKGYEPGNVIWATQHEQSRNRRSNRNLTVDGITRCVADWASVVGVDPKTIRRRLARRTGVRAAIFGSALIWIPF